MTKIEEHNIGHFLLHYRLNKYKQQQNIKRVFSSVNRALKFG